MATTQRDKLNRLYTHLAPGTPLTSEDLAALADAWSRTYRSSGVTFAPSTSAIVTANGIRVFPDRNTADWPEEGRLSTFSDKRPADALNLSLQVVTERYGERTTHVVAMQLEYPRSN
jgi:hypothetical protein